MTTKPTAAQIIERLTWELEGRERYVVTAKQNMINAMETGFIDSSVYERLIRAIADLKAWQRLDSALSKAENTHDGVQAYVEELTDLLVTWTPSNSTSDIARVKDRAQAEARREVLRVIKHWV